MKKKLLLTVSAILVTVSSTAQADYYNSFGARTADSPHGFYEQTDSCRMAAELASAVMIGYLGGAPERETLKGVELEEATQDAESNHGITSDELTLVKIYTYDMDEFSSAESFSEQFYQDCLEEK